MFTQSIISDIPNLSVVAGPLKLAERKMTSGGSRQNVDQVLNQKTLLKIRFLSIFNQIWKFWPGSKDPVWIRQRLMTCLNSEKCDLSFTPLAGIYTENLCTVKHHLLSLLFSICRTKFSKKWLFCRWGPKLWLAKTKLFFLQNYTYHSEKIPHIFAVRTWRNWERTCWAHSSVSLGPTHDQPRRN